MIEYMISNLRDSISQLTSSLSQGGLWIVVLVSVAVVSYIAVSTILGNRVHRRPVLSGSENLIAKTARVKSVLNPKGSVLIEGELWSATSEQGEVQAGEEVIITKVNNLELWVRKK